MGVRAGRQLAAGLALWALIAPAMVQAQTVFDCRLNLNGQSRGHFSETMTVTLRDAPQGVLVRDDLIDAVLGRQIKAELGQVERGRFSFDWQLLLKKNGGNRMVTFHMTIFPARGEASVSASWNKQWQGSTSVTANGRCRAVKG